MVGESHQWLIIRLKHAIRSVARLGSSATRTRKWNVSGLRSAGLWTPYVNQKIVNAASVVSELNGGFGACMLATAQRFGATIAGPRAPTRFSIAGLVLRLACCL